MEKGETNKKLTEYKEEEKQKQADNNKFSKIGNDWLTTGPPALVLQLEGAPPWPLL